MTVSRHAALVAAVLTACTCVATRAVEPSIQSVPITAVHLSDPFWAPRLETIRTSTIPALLDRLQSAGRLNNFVNAAAALKGQPAQTPVASPYEDADVYIVVEAASNSLATHPDPKLDAQLDDIIAKIAAAQEPDGYLYTARTVNPASPPAFAGAQRWANEKADSYELSNLGYLYSAAVAHFQATGKRSLLDVAVKSADLLDKTFGEGKQAIYPGHEGVEMGLVKLSQATGEKRYLALAKFFIDQRGPAGAAATAAGGRGGRGRGATNQSGQKVIDQAAVTGNAVDATFLYAGVADVATLASDAGYSAALDKLWANVFGQKMYVTGGLAGADGTFGRNYALPTYTAGSSAAAAAGSILWNQRMFQLHGDAKYIDILERTFYNALNVSLSADGKTLFDTSPLESSGQNGSQRRAWLAPGRGGAAAPAAGTIPAATAPVNSVRLLSALPGYIYATSGDTIYVNLFAASTAELKAADRTVKLAQETKFPADGHIKLTITPDKAGGEFPIKIRIPGWARNQAAPGDLYTFADKSDQSVSIKLNGKAIAAEADANGYATLKNAWAPGDVVDIDFPMPVRRIKANEQVADAKNFAALQRGPLVYCIDGPAIENRQIRNLVLPLDTALTFVIGGGFPQTNTSMPSYDLTGKASAYRLDDQDKPQHTEQTFAVIPYFNWANNGTGEMTVWIPTADSAAIPIGTPNLAATATITGSAKQAGQAIDGRAAKDGREERTSHSNDPLSHFDWWPDRSATEWMQYTWTTPQTITSTSIYYWDDSSIGGGCKVPKSWKASYLDQDGKWQPVETADGYTCLPDQYNKVTFKPVTTTALKVEMVSADPANGANCSIGVQEWKVR